MIKRDLTDKLKQLAAQFPAISLMGPRQSGKTTLVKMVFPEYAYFSFEDPDIRELVRNDPRAFLNRTKDAPGVIFDEVQHIPELFSYMQTHIDLYKKRGHFILTGSHNLLLNQAITQSLAGRTAILTLLPLSIHELTQAQKLPNTIDDTLFTGQYPIFYTDSLSVVDWQRSYINSYVERDVRQIQRVIDLSIFQKFLRLCAGRIGQVLNINSLSNDTGMSTHTIKQWLSILETTYIIFLLQPYYRNLGKRVIKSPKLYFYDTGLACSLLSITNSDQLFTHHIRGHLFESFIIADFIKQRHNKGLNPNIFFWRDKTDYEIDCIVEDGASLTPIEIKVSQTFSSHFFDHFKKWNEFAHTDPSANILLYGGELSQPTKRGTLVGWKNAGDII